MKLNAKFVLIMLSVSQEIALYQNKIIGLFKVNYFSLKKNLQKKKIYL